MRRGFLFLGWVLATVPVAVPAVAAPAAGPPPRVTLELQQVPLREGLKRLFENTPSKFGVDSAIPDVPVTLSVREIRLETALRSLLRAAAAHAPGLTFERTGNHYQVIQKAVPSRPIVFRSEEPGANERVSLELAGINLREALRKLVVGSLVRIHVHETVPDVPVNVRFKEARLPEAGRAIVRSAEKLVPGLAIRPVADGYLVWIDDEKPGLAGLPGMVSIPGTDEVVAKIRVRYLEVTRESWLVLLLQAALRERMQLRSDRMGARSPYEYTPGTILPRATPSDQ